MPEPMLKIGTKEARISYLDKSIIELYFMRFVASKLDADRFRIFDPFLEGKRIDSICQCIVHS